MIGMWIGDRRHHQVFQDLDMAKHVASRLPKRDRSKVIRFTTEPPMTVKRAGKVHRVQIGPRGGVVTQRVR